MPPDQPTLSFLICSRNDTYAHSSSLDRLKVTLGHLVALQSQLSSEIVLVDWGTDLQAELRLACNGRILQVPPSVTDQFSSVFPECLMLNLAARFARGKWLARLDQDTYPTGRAITWLEGFSSKPEKFSFFSLRRDLTPDPAQPPQVWEGWALDAPYFWRGAVGALVVSHQSWHQLRGYDERYSLINHNEHEFGMRLAQAGGLVNSSGATNAEFLHQFHAPINQQRPNNPMLKEEVLLQEAKTSQIRNDENWGLKNFWDQIKVVELPHA